MPYRLALERLIHNGLPCPSLIESVYTFNEYEGLYDKQGPNWGQEVVYRNSAWKIILTGEWTDGIYRITVTVKHALVYLKDLTTNVEDNPWELELGAMELSPNTLSGQRLWFPGPELPVEARETMPVTMVY